jgi:hypothetical protein
MSKRKKIVIGVVVLIAAPPFIAGVVSGVKDSGRHDSTAAAATPAASSIRPEAKPSAKPKPSTATHAATPGPAKMLADLDTGRYPVGDYQHALDALAPKCKQDEQHIAGIANGTLEDLQKNGVTDETELSVLQHLDQSIPKGAPRMDCVSIAASYATLREG